MNQGWIIKVPIVTHFGLKQIHELYQIMNCKVQFYKIKTMSILEGITSSFKCNENNVIYIVTTIYLYGSYSAPTGIICWYL